MLECTDVSQTQAPCQSLGHLWGGSESQRMAYSYWSYDNNEMGKPFLKKKCIHVNYLKNIISLRNKLNDKKEKIAFSSHFDYMWVYALLFSNTF